jgi:hypothetical protein
MVGKDGDVLRTLQLYLQREGPHGGLPMEGERSSMVEDAPTATEYGREDVSWELFEEQFRERYLSEEFMERQLNEFNALRQGGRTMLEHEARMALLKKASRLDIEKLWVIRFVLDLNDSLRARFKCFGCLKPCTMSSRRQSFRTSFDS